MHAAFDFKNYCSLTIALSPSSPCIQYNISLTKIFFSELLNGDDVTGLSRHAEGDESSRDGRERTESDLEIERQVHSLLDQIKQEPSWQYHLTTTDLDEQDDSLVGDSHLDDVATVHVNGEIDHTDIGHVNTEEHIEPNEDVNANQVDDVIATDDEILAKKMTGKRKIFESPICL